MNIPNYDLYATWRWFITKKNINLYQEDARIWINQLFPIIITSIGSLSMCKGLILKHNANLPTTITNNANYIFKILQIYEVRLKDLLTNVGAKGSFGQT